MGRKKQKPVERIDEAKVKQARSTTYAQQNFGPTITESILKSVAHSEVYHDQAPEPFIRYAKHFREDPTKALITLHNLFVRLNGNSVGKEKLAELGGTPKRIVTFLKRAKGIDSDLKALEKAVGQIF